MIPIEALIGKKAGAQKSLTDVPLDAVAEYSCEDADYTLRLVRHFRKELTREPTLRSVFEDMEMPLIPVLAHMELAGVKLNIPFLRDLGSTLGKKLRTLERMIHRRAGGPFNINSPGQLREVLFTRLKLPAVGIGRTQSGLSTAAEELEKLRDAHPIVLLLQNYRELSKLKSTYLDALPELADPSSGRVYTSYNQTVASTGRLSSSNPNLQNIPIRTEIGGEIRKAFIAERGQVLVAADYSQLELRIAAHIAKDRVMHEAFQRGKDIHAETAAFVFAVPPEKVTKEQRRQAKTLNFGILYGMGPQAFARAAGVPLGEAQAFIAEYMRTYRGIAEYMEEAKALAAAQGYVETIYGRRRYLPEIRSRNPQVRSAAERMAMNHPVQGTESDIIKRAMIALYERMQDRDPAFAGAKMILQVHDELVFEVPKERAENLARSAKMIMERMEKLSVPIVVDIRIGKNWGEMQEVH
jgi:DNA polymerase-1